MKRKITILLICMLPILAYAQEPTDSLDIWSMSLEQLQNLKVAVASNVVEDLQKQPVSVTSISREQLELSSARTLLDAIMLFVPGVFAVEDQDDVIMAFRGLAADNNSKVLLLINGINVNTEFFWGPPSAILNSTNYEYIEKVEVIRGPGSVTLGQGALLGVVNIITKTIGDDAENGAAGVITGQIGLDGFWGGTGFLTLKNDDLRAVVAAGINDYDGQTLREEGWVLDRSNDGYLGGNISDIGTRLKRSANENVLATVAYKNITVSANYFYQEKDLYNFYRDRNQIRQTLFNTNLAYNRPLGEQTTIAMDFSFSNDDFGLSSVDHYDMGGTRENRFGLRSVLTTSAIQKHNLAVGAAYKHFELGRKNRDGYNFINNVAETNVDVPDYIQRANDDKQWVFEEGINLISFFAEDYFNVSDQVDLFGAFRFDRQSFWGVNISPRLGGIYYPTKKLTLKASYQEGFRGAVGILYSGGFEQDGFLRSDNFSSIEEAMIPVIENGVQVGIESNIEQTKPEKISSTEFTIQWDINEKLNLNVVNYFNVVKNVIDVGVIFRDTSVTVLPNIGTDVPGDWNGYWFFKNTEGKINQFGSEATLIFKTNRILANLSHAMVRVISADEQQIGTMYLTGGKNFKAYPQNVTRLNLLTSISKKTSAGINYLYYYSWYSPSDQKVDGNHMLNASVKYQIARFLKVSIHGLNLLGASNLYPMTNNVNEPTLSDGTPSLERTSFWLRLEVNL